MSQSGSGGLNDVQSQNQPGQTMDNQQTTCQNGQAEPPADNGKPDFSNGFENRTMEYERFSQEKDQVGKEKGTSVPGQQTGQFLARKQSLVGVPEDRHPPSGQLPPQYAQEKPIVERVQHVSQTSTQTVPVQAQPQFAPDYDQAQYPQIRGQFEIRSQMYSQQAQYPDRTGYVRDVPYRDSALYSQGGAANPVFTGQGQYVTVQHGSQIPSQSTSPQPPYFSGVILPQPPGYTQFNAQSQYPYSQYPQALINAVPYTPHASIYPSQQFGQQSPNSQRFSQELTQYQTQPIIQPIAQNVAHGIVTTTERPARGPKPMVPPRGNSKITHDAGHRKSSSIDVGIQKPKYDSIQNAVSEQMHHNDGDIIVPVSQIPSESQDRRYVTAISQNPRTRQDGLYVDTSGEQASKEKLLDTVTTDCAMYISRSENRKSISVDVTTSFQRRNDTITFTFPGDGNQEVMLPGRKGTAIVDAKRIDAGPVYTAEQRRLDSILRVSPMAFEARQENRKSMGIDRKPEWGNISPNQRATTPQESRRSEYCEDHRRSPMNLEGKRMEDVRRSPMPFIPIRESSIDRAGQKSPSFVSQNFEKTRQELAIWAEQRQRQELERTMMHNQIFSTSPRSRNQEEKRESRSVHSQDEHKDTRMSQSAFQPIASISQSTIMEQRRHLRHISADLTKHMEFTKKDFDDQPISGSVANLGPTANSTLSQRISPNLCHQYPAPSESKLDTKSMLTVVTDFPEPNPGKPIDQVDHIIHSHRKSHNASSNLLTHSKSQTESFQNQLDSQNEKFESSQNQQHQQQLQQQNQQCLDLISEKLSEFERQQSDLQAKLQCLQNQNQLLDKVVQFQHQQSDLQTRLQSLQTQSQVGEKSQSLSTEPVSSETHQSQVNLSNEHQEQTSDKSNSSLNQHQANHLHYQSILTTVHGTQASNLQSCQPSACEKLSPRLQHDMTNTNSVQVSNMSQMPFPCLSQFDRGDTSRKSFSQFHRLQTDSHEGALQISTASTGTVKKVPPEKPPRTSLIIQSPEAEVNSKPKLCLRFFSIYFRYHSTLLHVHTFLYVNIQLSVV